jgi:hypothetical protein
MLKENRLKALKAKVAILEVALINFIRSLKLLSKSSHLGLC